MPEETVVEWHLRFCASRGFWSIKLSDCRLIRLGPVFRAPNLPTGLSCDDESDYRAFGRWLQDPAFIGIYLGRGRPSRSQVFTLELFPGGRQTFRYSVNEWACTRQLAENGAIRLGESVAEWRSTWSVVSKGNDRIDLQRPTGRNIARNNCYP
jgi:hypothetical protein